ncbi:MAG: 4-hydroxy-tetrahydrodipicolinate synthase [Candidatus Bruticola sp.]
MSQNSLVLGRVLTAMVTPFNSALEVDYSKAAQLARHLLNSGTDTIVAAATTGEAPTLTSEEKLRLFETLKNEIGDRPLVCGTGTNNTQATIDFSLKAKERGADAILVVAPYYNKPPQDALYEHFRAVAEAVDLPIIAYNIPGRTGIEIKASTLAKIASIPNIIAVKESLPSLEPISELSVALEKTTPEQVGKYANFVDSRAMEIYSGDDSAILPTLSVGGVGVISVTSHIAGPLVKEMIEAYFAGNVVKAQRLHLRLYPLFTGLFAVANPILAKSALRLQGLDVGGLRMPLRSASETEIERLSLIMKAVGIL